MLRYRRSGGRTELSEHQNTGNFAENPNSMVPRAGLGSFEKLKNVFCFARARCAANLCAERSTKSNVPNSCLQLRVLVEVKDL